jgi:uncharacterized protein (TIGR04255 family)
MSQIKSISPDPVKTAVVELRFTSSLPKEAIYGVLYNALRELCPESKALPIMQLPEIVRVQAPDLRWKPWYQLSGSGLDVQIGPEVLGVNCDCSNGYRGWDFFSEMISKILVDVKDTKLIETISRIGVRYISFFENVNIFEKLKLSIHRDGKPFCCEKTTFTTLLTEGDFNQLLSLNNDAVLTSQNPPREEKRGSTVDIDTFTMKEFPSFEGVSQIIEEGHALEKKLFFSLLKEDFLESLNPTYE